MAYAGYKLTDEGRERLLSIITPKYQEVIAHHVTHTYVPNVLFKLNPDQVPAIPEAHTIRIMGIIDDGRGLQTLITEVNGTTVRGDGGFFHLTYSLDPEKPIPEAFTSQHPYPNESDVVEHYKPKYSNTLIEKCMQPNGRVKAAPPYRVELFKSPIEVPVTPVFVDHTYQERPANTQISAQAVRY